MGACPNCGADLVGHSCKLRCPRCMYFESCSDLEPHPGFGTDQGASTPPNGADGSRKGP